jgi:hypothetical protein
MSDKELVKRLRASRAVWEDGRSHPTDDEAEAADRIEALTAERDAWKEQHAAEALGLHAQMQRADALQAKLAKAVEELERQVEAWSNALEFNILATQHRTSASILLDGVRATLAEIEGEKT